MSAPRSPRHGLIRAALRLRNDHGGVAVTFAVTITVVIGFAGAATEVGTWLLTRRTMQGVADAAAVSAVNAQAAGSPDFRTQAEGTAAQNGWADGVNGVTVTVNKPPSAGNFAGNTQAVEVIIAQAQPLFFSGLLPALSAPTIRARAVALPNPITGKGCLLALSPSSSSISGSGNGGLTLNGCDIDSNGGVSLGGNAFIHAHSKDIGGTVSLNGNAGLTLTDGPGKQNDPVLATDPNATFSFAKPTGPCTQSPNIKGNSNATLDPTVVYCSITISANANVTMPTGTYFIEGGNFSVSGNATLTSQSPGVTIIMTGTPAAPKVSGTVSITGNGNITLTGLPANNGLIFYQDPSTNGGNSDDIRGNGNLNLTGAIDFSKDTLNVGGNGSISSATCLYFIASKIVATGNASLASNCVGTGVKPIGRGAGATRLVE
jgi:hypothetical protein